jgi:hypothetical protein
MRLGVIYDSQVTNRKKGELPVRTPLSSACTPIGRLGAILYLTPSQSEYTKHHHK